MVDGKVVAQSEGLVGFVAVPFKEWWGKLPFS